MASLSNRTFGVEFEFLIPNKNIKAIQAKFPGKLNVKWTGDYDDYHSSDPKPPEKYIENGFAVVKQLLNLIGLSGWKVHEDGSIQDNSNEESIAVEVVSPILQGANGLAQVKKFCDFFGKIGKVNNSCGTHVHVGAADFKTRNKAAERLTLALLHYRSLEKVFDSLVKASRRGNANEYTQSPGKEEQIVQKYKTILLKKQSNLSGIIKILSQDRYVKLNIQSLTKHGTLEFRQMHGTLSFPLISNWIKIVTSFVDMIIETESDFADMFAALKPTKPNKEVPNYLSEIKQIIANPTFSYYFKLYFVHVVLRQIPSGTPHSISDELDSIRFTTNAKIVFSNPVLDGKNFKIKANFRSFHRVLWPPALRKLMDLMETVLNKMVTNPHFRDQGLVSTNWLTRDDVELTYNIEKFINHNSSQRQLEVPVSKQDISTVKQTIGKVNKPGAAGVPKHIPAKSVQAIQNLKEQVRLLNSKV